MMDVTKIVYLVLSLTLSYILFFVVTPWVFSDLNEHRLKKSTKTFSKKESIKLLDGVCDFGSSNTINTSNNLKQNYVDMPPSVNKEGGTEFSYTFWLKLDDQFKNEVTLFLKGTNPTETLTEKFSKVFDKNNDDISVEKLTKCPLVKISNSKLMVSFNTSRKIHNEIEFDIGGSEFQNIILSSSNNPRWFLFTIAFREGEFETDYGLRTKGVIADLYINEQHVKNKFIENDSIKLNKGNIYIFPDSNNGINGCQISNLNYYNWNLKPEEVNGVFISGPNTKGGCTVSGSKVINNQLNSLGRHGAQLFF